MEMAARPFSAYEKKRDACNILRVQHFVKSENPIFTRSQTNDKQNALNAQ